MCLAVPGEGDGGAGGSPTPARAHLYALPGYPYPFRHRGTGSNAAEQLDSIRHRDRAGARCSSELDLRDPSPVSLRETYDQRGG